MRLLHLTVPLLVVPLAWAATGGPDGGDMVYADADEADGPSHAWLDASGGAAYALGDDDTVTIDLPFAFDFYGEPRTTATISSNGVLFFDGATTSPVGACPGTSAAWTGIAAYWDDLDAGIVSTRTVGTYPSRTFVVSWEGATRGGTETGDVQLWLLEGRSEAVVVLDDTTWGVPASDDGQTAVIGTNGPDGGLAWSCDAAFATPQSIWFGDREARPGRSEVVTDDIDAPWTGDADFDYAGRALAAGDVDGDGTDDLAIGTQDLDAGVVSLVYRPGVGGALADADATFRGDAANDAFGAAVLLADLDADGQADLVIGAPGNDDGGSRAGQVYLWEAGAWGDDNDAADAAASFIGDGPTAAAGSALAAGDVDGDGYADLVIGAPTADDAASDAGAVFVIHGTGALPTGTSALSAAGGSLLGVAAGDRLGATLSVADLDADGAAEILVAAPFADDGAADAGVVYIVPGGSYAGAQAIDAAASCTLAAPDPGGRFGAALLAADLDGSGLLDLVVGASTEDGTYADGGEARLYADLGGACPVVDGADAVVEGARASAQLGAALAAGDIDGDGTDDLVASAPNMTLAGSGGGAVYAFTRTPSGTVSAADADLVLAGSGSAAALGTALAVAADDAGPATLVATAPYDSVGASSNGAIYAWTQHPDFLDADGDGFVGATAGGNDCDDAEADAFPDGPELLGDSVDGDCDGWVDDAVRPRTTADGWAWDLAELGAGSLDGYDFEAYADGEAVTTYADLAFSGDLTAEDRVYGAAPVDTIGARLDASSGSAVGIAFAEPIDALSLRVLDPDDTFTLVATGPSGTVVDGYTFALSGDDRTGGVYRAFTFADEVTAITLAGATTDGFGLDALEIAWAAESDRDGDGWSDVAGDCDDADPAVSPDAVEAYGNGIDDDCDGRVDAGNADAWTDAAAWAAAAGLSPSTTIDFEDGAAGLAVTTDYADLGVLFDGGLGFGADADGTPARGTLAGVASGASASFRFAEDQYALAFQLLDGDGPFTIEAYDDGVLYYSTLLVPTSADQFYGLVYDLSIDEVVVTGADAWGLDDLVFTALGQDDADGDGLTERDGDCDDADPDAYPGAPETWYDGVDADCAGDDDDDADGDGVALALDCDDTDPGVSPSASETYYDGLDANCDGASDYDADGDGHDDRSWGGDDCDDADGAVNPDATETWYDGVDADCAGDDDFDADGDGIPTDGFPGGADCDDADAAVNPDAVETWYDGVDSDCSGAGTSDFDADGDGHDSASWGGDDCDDDEALAYPGAPGEACYDGIDQDCDGANDYDCDGDGYAAAGWAGEDCDDSDPAVNPDAADAPGDGLDTNCDGGAEFDFDGDGYDGYAAGGDDCDDSDAAVNPGGSETCYDGIDQDCDGADDYDCDGDGHRPLAWGGDDCDDGAGGTFPGATDFPYDDVDADCDGADDFDRDGDGHRTDFYGGDDCDDADADAFPGAVDACYDGIDADCGGDDDDDCDGDGYAAEGAGGRDCDDADAAISPDAAEVEGDGIDQNCDGSDLVVCTDCDGDGYTWDLDCDDADADAYPGAPDAAYDGADSDCAGDDDFDADGDGATALAAGGDDCDDADPARSPANTTDPCGGGDEDCDGVTDEDCDFGEPDTGPEDTGTPDTDIPEDTGDTRDTAAAWRPEGEAATDPAWDTRDTGGCSTPGGPRDGATLGLVVVGALLARRRR